MILNETTAMFNGQLLFDRPMHVKMVSTFKPFMLSEVVNVLLALGDGWFQGWVELLGWATHTRVCVRDWMPKRDPSSGTVLAEQGAMGSN